MNSKVLKVFYGADNLPYQDKERVVHFPVLGNAFMGASNTTEIWFYFEKIGEPNNTWVAIAKLPNGKRGAVKLDTFNDTELNEPYAKLQLNTWFTQMRGDVYISLNGYDGGPILTKDPETDLYEVTGTPVIQATGSVKLTIQYATQLIGGDEVDEVTLQEIYAMFGEKLDTNKGIVVIANPQVDITQYDVGQYFYSKSDNSIYEKVVNEAEPIPVLTLRFTAYSKSESDTLLATKVDKTTDANIVYGTNNSGEQYKVPYSSDFSGKGNNLVQRDSNAQVNVPTTPTSNNHSTSKGYVDTQVNTRVAKTNSGYKIYGTDELGNQVLLPYDEDTDGKVVRRDSAGHIYVQNPNANGQATPKQYVDNGLNLKADKSTTYTKDQVDDLLASVSANEFQVVEELPQVGEEGIIYLVETQTSGVYDKYIYESNEWVFLGTTEIDLSDYYTKSEVDTLLGGKQNTIDSSHKLSADLIEDGTTNKVFTATEQTKLSGIESGAEVNVLEGVKVNGTDLTITNKKVDIVYDDELDENSENAVQNKVLKGYLDDIGNRLAVLEESIISDDSLNYTYLSDSAIPTNANTYPIIESAGIDNTNIKGNSVVYNQQLYVTAVPSQTKGGLTVERYNDGFHIYGNMSTSVFFWEIYWSNIKNVSGHKYLIYLSKQISGVQVYDDNSTRQFQTSSSRIFTSSGVNLNVKLRTAAPEAYDLNEYLYIKLIDLTQWFGSNDLIPTDLLNDPSLFTTKYWLGGLSYNVGKMTDSKPTALISKSFNIFDEEMELGSIGTSSGANITDNDRIRSKNYIDVIPNKQYYLYYPTNKESGVAYFYDKNKNYLTFKTFTKNTTHTTPENCWFMRFVCSANYGTTYNNNICINISNASLNGTYRPYKAPISYPLSLPVLRSALAIQDDAKKKYVGTVDLGTLDYERVDTGQGFYLFSTNITDIYTNPTSNLLCPNYQTSQSISWNNMQNKEIAKLGSNSSGVRIRDDSYTDVATFKSAMSGVYLNYPLATPTDQPAITLPENIEFEKGGSLEVTYDETAPTPSDFDFEVAVYKPIEQGE